MSILNKLKSEIKNAGTAARGAIDEGKVRIDIFRVRQSADAAAQALGYAVHRARRDGRELETATLERLDGTLSGHEAAASRLEAELARHRGDSPPAAANPAAPAEERESAEPAESGAPGEPAEPAK
ncbi:MAG: hypothetical protein O2973_02465 [Gemmatimonadetes bacterium]|nr:hypothetical protein [Gemmatimonadota bacterium]